MKPKLLVILILPMHLFLLYSIFDIYFTSPITSHLSPIPISHKSLANRLILYVVDGLRADKLYTKDMNTTPFLKNVIMNGNSWGLSNTRVPTETRPGHVALIAGFYEDVSSITKGWQENAVEFDSLFNRSSNTWSWGSSDVLPMFQKGAIKGKINIFCYKSELEDYAGNRTWELDTWVFNEVHKFFNGIILNSDIDKDLRREGVVIFLHLLGIDVNGHSQKPHSESYTKNLKIVSDGIENITNLINNFYQDNKTAFIVTSDHGMTDWGSHGAGSIDETATPIITWGAGLYNNKVSSQKLNKTSTEHNLFNMNFGSESRRNDVWQADLCVLMASILGIHIPINSVGVVPIDYIDSDDSIKAQILKSNIHQLFIQYETKYNQKKHSSYFHFYEYSELPMSKAYNELERGAMLISEMKFKAAIELYQQLSTKILGGISYYHKYDRFWLGFIFASSFILWIIYLSTHVVHVEKQEDQLCKLRHCAILAILLMLYFIFMWLEEQPFSYLIYQIVPTLILWSIYVFKMTQVRYLFRLLKNNNIFLFGVIILIESIVWSFFYRQVLSVGLLVTYLIILVSSYNIISNGLKIKWTVACILLMIYPNLPVIAGHSSCGLVFFGGIFNCGLSYYIFFYNRKGVKLYQEAFSLKGLFFIINVLTTFHVLFCQKLIQSGNGLSILSQIFSWVIFLSAIPIICWSRMYSGDRIDLLFTAVAIMYNLMSIYYELIFLFSLLLFSMTWKEIELQYRIENLSASSIDKRKIIQTIIYVFLLTYSFFATGNIASLNSFDVASTYCFITVFKPFLMGFILIVKIMLPMIVISLVYVFIQSKQSDNIHYSAYAPSSTLSQINIEEICLVTMISDFAALHFLFMIKDSGSWLEIGTSISHYVITMGISICAFLFTLLSRYLLNINLLFVDQMDEIKLK